MKPATCPDCGVEGSFAKVGRFPESTDERTYLVGWRCPSCDKLTVDVCPVGPIEPTPRSCLNCGEELAEGARCAACGMTASETREFLGLEGAPREVDVAEAAFERGLYRHAFAVLDALLTEDATRRDAWIAKGRRYQSIGLARAAARAYERALAIERGALVEIALGCAKEEAGEHEEAIRTHDALIAHHDDVAHRAIAYGNRANSLSELGRFQEAASSYERAVQLNPSLTAHWLNYATLLARRRHWSEVVAVADRALAVVPRAQSMELLLAKGNAENEQEHPDAGLSTADAALALHPEHPRALYLRGWALGMLGRLAEARDAMLRLIEIDPTSAAARAALEKIEAAMPPPKPWWKAW